MSVVSYGRERGFPTFRGVRDFKTGIVTETHKDRYIVMVDSEFDSNRTIADGLPFDYGDLFGGSGSVPAFLSEIGLDRDPGNRLKWYLDLTYIPLSIEDQQDQQQPPESRRPKWSWDFETDEYLVTEDQNNKKIVNAVGENIELTDPYAIPVLTIERYERTFDEDTITEYVDAVNSSAFWGWDSGEAYMAGIRDTEDSKVIWGGVKYRKVTYTIKFKWGGWQVHLLNKGSFYLDDNDPSIKIAFRDRSGAILPEGNLKVDGTQLPQGQPPIFLTFDVKREKNFNTLNLGPYT